MQATLPTKPRTATSEKRRPVVNNSPQAAQPVPLQRVLGQLHSESRRYLETTRQHVAGE